MVMKLLFSLDPTNRPHFDRKLLQQIAEQIGERQVAIISTVGGFREGKSFFDNILLKGLQMRGDVHFETNDVIGGSNGVPFKRGTERHTVGIQIWDRVFYRKDNNGFEVAVLLLDTQGMFDMESQMKQSTIIFIITLMISSHLIYNKMKLLDARDLDQLNVFIEMSRMGRGKIGQNLLFLMRDWQGEGDGGNTPGYLAGLRSSSAKAHDLKNMVDGVYNAFEKVDCWTVFPPGGSVVKADGSIRASDCDPTFLKELSACADHILRNLATRKVMGTPLNGKTLETYIQQVVDHVRDNSVHCVNNALEATIRLCFEKAKEVSMKDFSKKIQELERQNGLNPMSGDILRAKLAEITRLSLEFYENQPCFGSSAQKSDHLMVIREQFKLKTDEIMNRNEERLRQQQANEEKQRQIDALVAENRLKEKRREQERQQQERQFLEEQRLREHAERARQEEQRLRENAERARQEEQERRERDEQERRRREDEQRRREQVEQAQRERQMFEQMMRLQLQMQPQSQPSGFSGFGHPSPNNYFRGGGSGFGNRSVATHSCNCRTGCTHGNCGCRRRGQPCNNGCGCTDCVN